MSPRKQSGLLRRFAPRNDEESRLSPHQLQPLILRQHGDAVLLRFRELRAGARAGDDVVGLLRYRARGLGAETLSHRLGLVAGHLFQRAGEHHGLAGDRRIALRLLGVDDLLKFLDQAIDNAAVVALAKIGSDRLDDGVADLVERIHLRDRLLVALGDLEPGIVERLPGAITARQRQRRGLADMAHAERIDETLQRNLPSRLDRIEQVTHRGFAVTLDLLQLQPGVALLQRENIGRLPHPAFVEEILQLLFAEAVDVERTARREQLQVLDPLVGTGELARATGARALLAGRGLLAHHVGVQRARALLREVKLFRAPGPLVDHDVDDLRDHVAGALDHHRVADPDIAALAELLAIASDTPDVVLIVQRHVLHDDAADADRLELADRRERAGAADLDFDVAQHGHGALGREFVCDAPARRSRDEAEPLLPVDAIDLVDDAVDVVVELGALFLDLAMERDKLRDG